MKNIPILIINRDRLIVEKLVDHLRVLGYDNIYILDMSSTYPPLLEYYKTTKAQVIVLPNNGIRKLWDNGVISMFKTEWVAVTDSDIELYPDTPADFIDQMIIAAKDFRIDKVGLAIEYRNITNEYLRDIIEPIEKRYWLNQLPYLGHIIHDAQVDTTFHICRPDKPFSYQAIRMADWPVSHIPWYEDWNNLTEEQLYYFTHADERIATIKQHYLKWRTEKGL